MKLVNSKSSVFIKVYFGMIIRLFINLERIIYIVLKPILGLINRKINFTLIIFLLLCEPILVKIIFNRR